MKKYYALYSILLVTHVLYLIIVANLSPLSIATNMVSIALYIYGILITHQDQDSNIPYIVAIIDMSQLCVGGTYLYGNESMLPQYVIALTVMSVYQLTVRRNTLSILALFICVFDYITCNIMTMFDLEGIILLSSNQLLMFRVINTVVIAFITMSFTAHTIMSIRLTVADLQQQNADILMSNAKLTMEVNVDKLTGLYNRGAYEEELNKLEKSKHERCLILIDIDNFKQINDTLGHACGDKVLEKLAYSIGQCTNGLDKGFRWGGDEFAIIPESPKKALWLAESIVKSFKGNMAKATLSIGIASVDGAELNDTLFERADSALYKSKETKNKITVYEKGDVT